MLNTKPQTPQQSQRFIAQGNFKMTEFSVYLGIRTESFYVKDLVGGKQKNCFINLEYSYEILKKGKYWILVMYIPTPVSFYTKNNISHWEKILNKVIKRKNFILFHRVHDFIDQGTFGAVYKTQQIETGKIFATKNINKSIFAGNQTLTKSLLTEINCLRSLNHKNVIKFEGLYESEKSIQLVMELADGCSLIKFIQKIPISLVSRKQIMYLLLEGVNYLHQNNIAHNDLKPMNIMVTNSGEIKIVDFGQAENCQVKTNFFHYGGTDMYKSPERFNYGYIKSMKGTACCGDIFSLGLILYQMIFRQNLFFHRLGCPPYQIQDKSMMPLPYVQDPLQRQIIHHLLNFCPFQRPSARQLLKSRYFDEIM